MASGVLVDTCIWIEFFRNTRLISDRLQGFIEKGTVHTSGIILYELFQGIRNEKEKTLLEDVFKGIAYVEMSPHTWLNAAWLSNRVRKKGLTLPPSDIFLAQLSLEHELSIFTIDDHFNHIPGVKLIRA